MRSDAAPGFAAAFHDQLLSHGQNFGAGNRDGKGSPATVASLQDRSMV
ncbi:hypothetical protein [Streptomyces sp. NPDC002889]